MIVRRLARTEIDIFCAERNSQIKAGYHPARV